MSCRNIFYLALPLAALALTGCDKPTADDPARPGSPAPAGPYYNLRGQLDSLTKALDARHAPVQKQVSLRDSPVETKQVDQVKWADELQLFYQADINKAALRGAYDVEVTHSGPSSGPESTGMATRYVYTLKPGHPNAPVKYLTVWTAPDRRLQELDATIEQHNALFSGRKQLRLRLNGTRGTNDGITYEVVGQQKLILFDSLRFHTAARVL